MMKRAFLKPLLAVLCVAVSVATFTSCTDDDENNTSYCIANNALGW